MKITNFILFCALPLFVAILNIANRRASDSFGGIAFIHVGTFLISRTKKNLQTFLIPLILFSSCQNRSGKSAEMLTYYTSDSTISCKVPSYMSLTKKDHESVLFQGNQKLVQIIKTSSPHNWDLEKFAQSLIGNKRSELTLTESNDTLIVYEIQKGIITIPAHIFSLHERNGYSIMVMTLGLNLSTHNTISNSVISKATVTKNETALYEGKYMNLYYPSDWIVDEHPKSMVADVYIGQKNYTFGMWLFRIENESGISFREAMSEMGNSYRGIAKIDLTYEKINGREWCKQNIQMNVQGQKYRQISYYCQNRNHIYNVKFGNRASDIQNNGEIINSIMASINIK